MSPSKGGSASEKAGHSARFTGGSGGAGHSGASGGFSKSTRCGGAGGVSGGVEAWTGVKMQGRNGEL